MPGPTSSRVLRKKHEAFHKDCINKKTKFAASVMVWGCFSARGMGQLHFVEGTVNAMKYEKILEEYLLPSIPMLESTGGEFIFQQDGASCHTARRIKSWLADNDIQTIPWPANSPDMSPIETIWGLMKKKLRQTPAKTVDELKTRLKVIWDEITPDLCANLVDTMPKRVLSVIQHKGGVTEW